MVETVLTGGRVEVTVLVVLLIVVSVVVLTDISVVVAVEVGVGFIGQSEFEIYTEKLYSTGEYLDTYISPQQILNSQHKLLGNHMI